MNPWAVLVIGLVLMAIGALSPFGGLFLIAGFVMAINAARIIFRRK